MRISSGVANSRKVWPEGRGIHHNEVIGLGFDPRGDFQQRHEFIQAGQREVQEPVDVFLIQKGAPGGDLGKFTAVFGLEGLQGRGGVELQDL